MSLDLKIIPVEAKRWELQSGFGLQYERDSLMFVGDYRIFEQIQETVPTHPLPEGVKLEVYSEGGIEHRRNDSYGDELTFVLAGDLKKSNGRPPNFSRGIVPLKLSLKHCRMTPASF